MLDLKLEVPPLVTQPGELEELCHVLSREAFVGVDTESNSLHAYRERVCLIQFSIPEGDFLVDPLEVPDLSPLGSIFANPQVEKVFHAAEYDLVCLKRDYGFEFASLFDTMVAASILGRNEVGLGNMLEAELGVQIDKRYQRANWGQRPLPPHLVNYAQQDTHYLISLRRRLQAELVDKERWELAQEDFGRLCLVSPRPNDNGENKRNAACWRLNGASALTPQQAAVLSELCRYRDQVAQVLDRPLFKVFHDATLVEIARACPHSIRQLSKLPGMSPGQIRRHGSALLQAVQRGLQAPPIYPPNPARPDDRFLARLEKLRIWRKNKAGHLGVKSDVILPRDLMYGIAESDPRGMDELAMAMSNSPWRLEQFGKQILEALSHS